MKKIVSILSFKNSAAVFLLLTSFFSYSNSFANKNLTSLFEGNQEAERILISNLKITFETPAFEFQRPNPGITRIIDKLKRKKKTIAALLAFPLPFGIIGLHRIYLGTKPYIPLTYIATFGGAFGVLPFIDFWVLIFDKSFEKFEHNEKVFMWIK